MITSETNEQSTREISSVILQMGDVRWGEVEREVGVVESEYNMLP